MHESFTRQPLSTLISQSFSRVHLVFVIGLFCYFNSWLYADPWKCGTPLLIDDTRLAQDRNLNNTNEAFAAPAAPSKVGQTQRFFVHIPKDSVNAICLAVGLHCYIFIDTAFQDMLTETMAKTVAETFDTRIYPKVQHWLGSELKPGLDRDNRITILFHDVGMNESGQDYGGYFSPQDLQPLDPYSNRRDMLYMDIFQFKERSRHTFYSSLAHEFAHLVNWYQNGGTTDQRWLEEGIASFTEWGVYGTVHNLFVDNYLAKPSMSLTTENTTDTYYGGAFLLLLYLYEKHGGINFIRNLADEDSLGLSAISATLNPNKHLVDVFLNWGTANWFNNPSRGSQYNYQNLRTQKVTAHPPRTTRYPKTSNEIPINSWSIHYYLFQSLPNNLNISLYASTLEHLHANVVYMSPNSNLLTVTPIPSVSNHDAAGRFSTNEIKINNLSRNGQILLVVTSELPQNYRYVVEIGAAGDGTNIEELGKITRAEIERPFTIRIPNSIDYLEKINSQPISINERSATSLITSNRFPRIEPMSQIHLSSNYNTIVVQNRHAFATSQWGLEIFSLSPAALRIGEIGTPGDAQALAIDGNTVYVADGESGVHVIDSESLSGPRLIKTLGGFQDARDVHVADGNLYALDAVRGLLVFNQQDIGNIEHPHPRSTFRTAGTPFKITTNEDGTIFLSDNARGLYLLSNDPLGGYLVDATIPLLALDFEIFGNYALTVSRDLRIINIGSPLATQQISGLNTPGTTTSVTFYEGLLYLTDQQSGLHIVDVNRLKSPRLISSHATIGNAQDVAFWYSNADENTYAYIADGMGGIQTLDITEREKPIWLSNYNANGKVYDLDVQTIDDKTLVAVANGVGGVKIAELSHPYTGRVTHDIGTVSGSHGALCVQVEKDYAFVGTDAGMDIVNLMNQEIVLHISTSDPVWKIEIIGEYAYLCAKSLNVVDISDPKRSRVVFRSDLEGDAYRISFNTDYAFIAALEGGVHIFNISDPIHPRPISHFPTQGAATNVTYDDDHMYILDNRNGVLQIDIQDIQHPQLISEYTDTELPIDAAIIGNHLYVLDSESIQIIDTRAMERLTRYSQLQAPTGFTINDKALYVCDLNQLKMFRIQTDGLNLGVEEVLHDRTSQHILPTSIQQNLLLQNYPNPFNPETWIPYTLSKNAQVSLTIYDVQGRLIKHYSYGFQQIGKHTAYWNGKNTVGENVASGVYFYTLNAGDFSTTAKMNLQR